VTENQVSTNMFSTISKFQYIDQKRDNLNRKKEPSNNVTHTHAIHNYQTYALIRYTACFKIPAKSWSLHMWNKGTSPFIWVKVLWHLLPCIVTLVDWQRCNMSPWPQIYKGLRYYWI
jgi:hypothetical protein